MVCEKPDAAARVALAIDEEGIPRKQESQGVPFFECGTKEGTVVVCSALGHLYAVASKGGTSRRAYPVWDYEWKPRHEVERASARLGRWIQVISSLARTADRFVNGCDYDIEGSLIGETVLQYACGNAHLKAGRMKFSTMTEGEIKNAYRTLAPKLDFSLAEAGRCRHELDWLYGINLSRVMTESVLKQNRGYATLSTGRVQGPTLGFVVEREEEIACFTPTPYWKIDAAIKHEGREYDVDYYREKVPALKEAEQTVLDCKDKMLEVKDVESHDVQQAPPYPFDLSTLQSEAFRCFGYSPSRTLAASEKLYLEALISYPRTSSQKLPPDIGYERILRGLAEREYRPLTEKLLALGRLYPKQGVRDDPAHPAIYPTGEKSARSLVGPEAKVFDLIVRRFMSTFAEPAVHQSSRAVLERGSHKFFLRGLLTLKPGWTEFYRPYVSLETQELPPLKVGVAVPVCRIAALEKFTQPPPRFNSAGLLGKMEEANIGTKATRAEIIEILYKRGYVKEPRMKATPLAVVVARLLGEYCPLIVDPGFTAKLEELMASIQEGKTTRKLVLLEALQHLRPVMLGLVGEEEKLGVRLGDVVTAQRMVDASFKTPCPQCGSTLKIVRNKRTGKRFIGCSGKWEKSCGFALPLPPFGRLTILNRLCKVCGFQMIQARSRGRRPLVSCPRCYVSKAREKSDAGPGGLASQAAPEVREATT